MARFLILCLVIIACRPQDARGCYCFEPPPGKTFEARDAVFAGRVVATESLRRPDEFHSDEGIEIYEELTDHTFHVLATWKPISTDTLVVRTKTSSSCAFRFRAGVDYLVYADLKDDGFLWSWQCSRSEELPFAMFDRYWLGEPQIIDPDFRFDPVSLEELIAAVDSGDRRLRSEGIEALRSLYHQEDAIPPVVEKMFASEDSVRVRAALGIYAHLGEAARPFLPKIETIYREAEGELRRHAYATMAPDPEAPGYFAFLQMGLCDHDPGVQAEAARLVPRFTRLATPAQRDQLLNDLLVLVDEDLGLGEPWRGLFGLGFLTEDLLPNLDALARDHEDVKVRESARSVALDIRRAVIRDLPRFK